MKLEKWALVAEVVGGFSIVITLIFLLFEVRANTEATLATNRQSLASRAEAFLLAQATSPAIAHLHTRARRNEELADEEVYQYAGYLGGFLRLAEEGYLQYLDGNLDVDYWRTRARNTVDSRLNSRVARELWYSWTEQGWFTPAFEEWLDRELEAKYGPRRPE